MSPPNQTVKTDITWGRGRGGDGEMERARERVQDRGSETEGARERKYKL